MRRTLLTMMFGVLVLLGFTVVPAAHAATPVTVDGVVTDETGSISSSERTDLETSIEALRGETGVTLYIVVVDRFESPSDGFDWATAVAERNALTSSDIIMYVGMSDLETGLNATEEVGLSDQQFSAIEREYIPRLDDGDVAGAAQSAVAGLERALTGASGGTTQQTSGTNGGSSSDTGAPVAVIGLLVIVAVVVLGIGTWLVVRAVRTRTARNAGVAARRRNLEELASQAAASLVQADDLIKTSEQEVLFAEAQFGADAVTQYRAALEDAKLRVQAAFGFQGKLLDHVEDTEEEKLAWNREILGLTKSAGERIAAEAQTFEKLRDMERNAPELLRQVTGEAERLSAQIDAAETSLSALRERYAPTALTTIDDAVRQARGLLQLTVDEAQHAQEALRTGKRGHAAVDIGDAQEALAQTATLLGSIEAMRDDLNTASTSIRSEITELRADIARIEASGGSPLRPELAQRNADAVRLAQDVVATAEAEGQAPPDPLATLARLREANRTIDEAVRSTTEEAVRIDGVRRRLERDTQTARAQIRACADYISSHRGVVGVNARSRLQQAETELARAGTLAATDPDAALEATGAAIRYSSAATDEARREADQAERNYYGGSTWNGGGSTWGAGSNGSSDAFIGGLIGGILGSGGSSRGGGFSSSGGSRSRSSGGFRASGGGFRSSSGFRSSGGSRSSGGFRSSGGGRRR
ncbi:putative nucleic acid-binding Zn-ribbon protein [Pseudoclavibacter chungangensis]|uniref:TPM domain-containing protein n=1 Tax=Pseudoclavibacter chungangensis TaxID=587635 RepID=UPI0015CA3611|nr:TPM domain-containing protein [Pseudoclavibacter chungangensis]NYJ66187.1 putative nucleic acid-binding Zn-ribbon protein [Pseudoclavibacter chungangensis]